MILSKFLFLFIYEFQVTIRFLHYHCLMIRPKHKSVLICEILDRINALILFTIFCPFIIKKYFTFLYQDSNSKFLIIYSPKNDTWSLFIICIHHIYNSRKIQRFIKKYIHTNKSGRKEAKLGTHQWRNHIEIYYLL